MIRIGIFNLTDNVDKEDIKTSILNDLYSYGKDAKYFKALKRLYSYAKLINAKKLQNDLISIFNSSLGEDYKTMSDLNTLLMLLEQKFKPINKEIILTHLKMMKINTNNKKLKPSLNYMIDTINKNINEKLVPIIKSNKNIYIYFASFF